MYLQTIEISISENRIKYDEISETLQQFDHQLHSIYPNTSILQYMLPYIYVYV